MKEVKGEDEDEDEEDDSGGGVEIDEETCEMLSSGNGSCSICYCEPDSKPLTLTRCCQQQVICDTSQNYYRCFPTAESFVSALTSGRYTLCGYHYSGGGREEGRKGRRVDWRCVRRVV